MATPQTAGSTTAGSNTTASSAEAARARKDSFDFASDYISILHAGEQNPLGGWDKQVRLGSIKRRTEDSLGPGQRTFHAIEIAGSNSYSTYIVSPKVPFAELNIHLPNLVLVCKNTGRNFTFEVQVEDDRGLRHRFNFSNSNLQVPRRTPFLTFIPLRFQDGWNDVCIDLAHLTEKVYGLKFVKVLRVKIFANIRLQQVFFVNDAIWTGQCPVPALKMMNNVHMIPTTHLPMVNPLWRETGPEQRQIPQVPDPLDHSRVTRVEAELSQRGARVLSLPPTPPISAYTKNALSSSPSFSSKSKPSTSRSFQRAALLRSRSKSPAGGISDSSYSFKNQLLKVTLPEADEAMKLLNVVKNMHLNPKDDPTVYVAALKKLRQAEAHSKRAYKRVTNIGTSKSTPQHNVETSGFTTNLGGAASQVHSNDSKSASTNTNVATSSKNVSESGKSPSRISNNNNTNSVKPAKLIVPAKDSKSTPPNVNAASTSTNISTSEKSSGVAKSKTKHSVGTSTEVD